MCEFFRVDRKKRHKHIASNGGQNEYENWDDYLGYGLGHYFTAGQKVERGIEGEKELVHDIRLVELIAVRALPDHIHI